MVFDWKSNLPLLVIDARQVSMHDCIIRTEIERTQVRCHGSATKQKKKFLIISPKNKLIRSGSIDYNRIATDNEFLFVTKLSSFFLQNFQVFVFN